MRIVAFRTKSSAGFTLVELIFVVLIITLLSVFAVTRVDSVIVWKQREDIRKFAHSWQFLHNEATGRSEAYRLMIDISNNNYYVLREVVTKETDIQNVDYLENLRLESEKRRREEKKEEEQLSLDQEFTLEDERQGGVLDELFYETVFRDPSASNVRLTAPLDFPNLAEKRKFTDGLIIRDVLTPEGKIEEGVAVIRFSPRGASDFAVVHFAIDEASYTVLLNPSTGRVRVEDGYQEYEWSYGNTSRPKAF